MNAALTFKECKWIIVFTSVSIVYGSFIAGGCRDNHSCVLLGKEDRFIYGAASLV